MLKHKQVREAIVESLGYMQPNQRYLSRYALCRKYQISRTTADKIVKELIEDGLMYTTKGSGTFVAPRLPPVAGLEAGEASASWGIILPDIRYNIYPDFFSGIERFCKERKIDIMVCNSDDDPGREHAFIERLMSAGINGLIIVPSAQVDTANYRPLIAKGTPFVFWNRTVDALPDVPQICLNGYHGGLLATRHLIKCGYKRVAYLAPRRFRSSMDRFFGYQSALALSGIPYDAKLINMNVPDDRPEIVREVARNMLLSQNPPDAFVCFVDLMALPVCGAVRDMGLRVSADVGVIGFESQIVQVYAQMAEKLTYIHINSGVSGYLAAETLYRMMLKRPYRNALMQVVQPELVVRDTCLGPEHAATRAASAATTIESVIDE